MGQVNSEKLTNNFRCLALIANLSVLFGRDNGLCESVRQTNQLNTNVPLAMHGDVMMMLKSDSNVLRENRGTAHAE